MNYQVSKGTFFHLLDPLMKETVERMAKCKITYVVSPEMMKEIEAERERIKAEV